MSLANSSSSSDIDSNEPSDDTFSTTHPSGTSSTTQSIHSKRKRKCLRLDIRHHRNIFRSTFYRIWMYRRRNILLTLFQIFFPPFVMIGMTTYLGNMIQPEMKGWSNFPALSEEDLSNKISDKGGKDSVITCYVQNNQTVFAKNFMSELNSSFLQSNIKLLMVDRKEDMFKESVHYHLRGESQKYIGGIEIKNPFQDPCPECVNGIGENFKLQFSVSMAQKTPGFYFQQRSLFFDVEKNMPHHYYKLLGIELVISRTFHKLILGEVTPNKSRAGIALEVQSLSYPPHPTYYSTSKERSKPAGVEEEVEEDIEEIDTMLATIFVLSMIPVFYTVVEGPVTEKENGFKLYLLLMGYPRGAYWFSWILNQMIIQLIVIGLQTWLLFNPIHQTSIPLIRNGSWSVWFFVLVLYHMSCLSFFVFLAAFFRRGKMATNLALLIWLLSYHILQSRFPSFDFGYGLSPFIFSCLVPSGCIYWMVFILHTIHYNSWRDSFSLTLTLKSGFKLRDVVIMLIINFFMYFLLTLYVDNLQPRPLESKQPWNYFFEGIRCRYIDPNRDYIDQNNLPQSGASDIEQNTAEQKRRCSKCFRPGCEKKAAIEFQQISKKFQLSSGVYGIENVKFTAYAQHITVLLGHRDSGRTTLMRLLCGEYAPTSGTALVFGYNVRKDTQKVQSFLSVCLEHNCLCEYLTVMEHMTLIGKLKGLKSHEAKVKSKKILGSLDLLSQSNDKLWKLVKWQRRVLCIAMALLGNAPILLLDEPTKDLDLDAKRQIWSLMKELKSNGRTIVMSTNDIEEAYQVGDRIVIMSRGRVAGVGSPSKLEHIFETGYHLILQGTPAANPEEILTFLKQYVPSACELEGGLSQVKKTLQVADWDQSQACLLSLPVALPVVKKPAMDAVSLKTSMTKLIGYFMGKGPELDSDKEEVTKEFIELKAQESTPTIVKFSSTASDAGLAGMEMKYVLKFGQEANFPRLFSALDNSNVMLKLGIKKYELKLHDMGKAFNEVDDYVDVINAAAESPIDLDFGDFADIKALRSLIEDRDHAVSLPKRTNDSKKKSPWCMSVWVLIVKRLCHIFGNFRHSIVQILAPVIISMLAIISTASHFDHRLVSQEVPFNASTTITVPTVPYRISSSPLTEEFLESFMNVIGRPPNNLERLQNIGAKKFEDHYKKNYRLKLQDEIIIAADFTNLNQEGEGLDRKVTALFSPGHYHSAPLSLMLMFNSLLDFEFPMQNYSIEMTGRSMSHKQEWMFLLNNTFTETLQRNSVDVTLAVSLAFGYFIFTSGFVTQPCSEKFNKLKRYQMYCLKWNGLYWISNAIIDMFFNIVTVVLLTVTMYFQPHDAFKHPQFIILFVITCTFGGFASILISYFLSHFLLRHETSYYAVLSVNQVIGLAVYLFYTILNFEYFGSYARDVVAFVLLIGLQPFTVPWNFHTAVLWALDNGRCTILNKTIKAEMCSTSADGYDNIAKLRGECCSGKTQHWDGSFYFIWNDKNLFWSTTILAGHCGAWIFILMYMESRQLRRHLFGLLRHSDKPPQIKNENDWKTIEREQKVVDEALDGKNRENLFIVRNVGTSNYARHLLYPMSFCCEPGKCTAVVGPETSGLTMLYSILSGIRAVSEGEVTFGGYSLLSRGSRKKFLYQLGLCPSEEVIVDNLTGLQLLRVYGKLRGISSKDLPFHTEYWSQTLGLEKVITERCHYYSVVTKKKLAVALAVIGNPQVVIFDEPTKDLDPLSRCQVCKVLEGLVQANRVVLILTHVLSSIERICNKLIFLVNGQMQFCESTDAIYKDIENDFTLIVKLKVDELGKINVKNYAELKSVIESEVQGISLQEEQSNVLVYRIKDEKYVWATVFEKMEEIVKSNPDIVSEYHIRRTSLKDVYNSYAVNQRMFRIRMSAWAEFLTTYC